MAVEPSTTAKAIEDLENDALVSLICAGAVVVGACGPWTRASVGATSHLGTARVLVFALGVVAGLAALALGGMPAFADSESAAVESDWRWLRLPMFVAFAGAAALAVFALVAHVALAILDGYGAATYPGWGVIVTELAGAMGIATAAKAFRRREVPVTRLGAWGAAAVAAASLACAAAVVVGAWGPWVSPRSAATLDPGAARGPAFAFGVVAGLATLGSISAGTRWRWLRWLRLVAFAGAAALATSALVTQAVLDFPNDIGHVAHPGWGVIVTELAGATGIAISVTVIMARRVTLAHLGAWGAATAAAALAAGSVSPWVWIGRPGSAGRAVVRLTDDLQVVGDSRVALAAGILTFVGALLRAASPAPRTGLGWPLVTGFGLAALVGALFTARTNPGLLLAADGTVAVPGWGFPVVVATSLLGVGWAFLVALTERASDAANGSDGRGRAVRWAVTAAATVVITAVLPVWPFFVDDPHRSAALLLGLVALAAALAPTRSTRWSAGFDLLLFATSGFAALISVGGSLDYANLSLVPEFDLWNMGPIIVLLAGGIGAAIGLAQFVRRLHAATKTAALSAAPTEPTGLGG